MKREIYFIGTIIILLSIIIIGGRRLSNNYDELELRYNSIEESNKQLSDINSRLIENNKGIRDLQQRDAKLLYSARGIIENFQGEIVTTNNTIDRIESGVRTLGEIIRVLSEKSEDLEDDSLNRNTY